MSSPQVITARIRGFICLNAHPVGCATNVARQIDVAKAGSPGTGIGDALILGASTGYGLSSLLTTTFGYGARAVGVCLERPPHGEKTASAGWYNLVAARRFAKAEGRTLDVVNGDAYSNEIKAETIAALKRLGMKLDTIVYSLASPRRTDPVTGQTFMSVLKPLGQPFSSRSINLGNDQLVSVDIAPASPADVEATVKVMGGEDWALWIRALAAEGLLAQGLPHGRVQLPGPALTYPIYRSGTIGRAKEHLEQTAAVLTGELAAIGGPGNGQREQGPGDPGVQRHPGRAALHQHSLQGDEGKGHARGNDPADRPSVPRRPGAGRSPEAGRGRAYPPR